MRIKEIFIENFKAFPVLKFNCNADFNIIVGENNIGKSTILESIQLWKVAYSELIQKNNKNFYGDRTPCYISFESLYFLRITKDSDLFNNSRKNKCSITITFDHENIMYPLKITLEKTTIPDSYFRIKYDFDSFNLFKNKVIELGLNLRNAIVIYQTRPIFYTSKREPFFNNAQLFKKILLGKSHEVIRNKILKTESAETKYKQLEDRINKVFNTKFAIRTNNRRKQEDEFVKVWVKENNGKEVEISMMGSGILQVLEIFATIEFITSTPHCVTVLLIDEPDSHIHSNLQSKLINEIKSDANYQSFLVSHNDRLTDKADDGELFYINSKCIENGEVKSLPKGSYSSVKEDLAKDLFLLEKSETDKVIILTEGKTDKKILETAWSKLNPDIEIPYSIIPAGREIDEEKRTGSADSVQQTLEFISNLLDSSKIVGLFDNDLEGNTKFKGLKKHVFETHSLENNSRKHLEKDIYGLLLPIPNGRESFVSNTVLQDRFLAIEHFFSNEILDENNMIKSYVMNTEVFRIKDKKNDFSELVKDIDAIHFTEFEKIFSAIDSLFIEEEVVIEI